jgi:hypothetical protein
MLRPSGAGVLACRYLRDAERGNEKRETRSLAVPIETYRVRVSYRSYSRNSVSRIFPPQAS